MSQINYDIIRKKIVGKTYRVKKECVNNDYFDMEKSVVKFVEFNEDKGYSENDLIDKNNLKPEIRIRFIDEMSFLVSYFLDVKKYKNGEKRVGVSQSHSVTETTGLLGHELLVTCSPDDVLRPTDFETVLKILE
jgi:hypothetical protein